MSFLVAGRRFWARLGPRDRRALALGGLVLLPLAFWAGLVQPYRAALDDARSRLEAERALLAREEGLLATADQLPGNLDEARLRLDADGGRLIRVANDLLAEARLSDALQDYALTSRVLILEVRQVEGVPPESGSAIGRVRLAIRAESDLTGLSSFLERVEAGPLMMRVIEVSVEPAAPRSNQTRARDDGPSPADMGTLAISAIIEAYWIASDGSSMASEDVVDTRLTGIPP